VWVGTTSGTARRYTKENCQSRHGATPIGQPTQLGVAA